MGRRNKPSDAQVFSDAFYGAYNAGAPVRQKVALDELGKLTDQEGAALGAPPGLSRDLLGAFLQGRASLAESNRQDAEEKRKATEFTQGQEMLPQKKELLNTQVASEKEALSQLKLKPGQRSEENAQDLAKVLVAHGLGDPLTVMKVMQSPDTMKSFIQDVIGAVHGKSVKKYVKGGATAAPKADASNQGMVEMISPSGKKGSIPKAKQKEAEAAGFKVAQ